MPISPAGEWLLHSGIQEPGGGVARYYRADLARNLPVSTEITGYAVSAFVYLHSVTGQPVYLDRALATARFLTRTAWNPHSATLPFELDPPAFTYFFDCGIVVRGLLAAWRATGDSECLSTAAAIGRAMAADFRAADGSLHPILRLPSKRPAARDPLRWSHSDGCYQLKSAMAWWDLAEATGDETFREPYEHIARPRPPHLPRLSPRPSRPPQSDGPPSSVPLFPRRAAPDGLARPVAPPPSPKASTGRPAIWANSRPSSSAPMSTPSFCASACLPSGPAPLGWIARRRSPKPASWPGFRPPVAASTSAARAAMAAPRESGIDGLRVAGSGTVAFGRGWRFAGASAPPSADLNVASRFSSRLLVQGRAPGRPAASALAPSRSPLPAPRPAPHSAHQPGISVVIPSRNGRDLLAAQFPGIVRELAPFAHEILVVDNGSTDGTEAWLRADWPARWWKFRPDLCPSPRAVNRGIRRGALLARLPAQ